MSKTLKKRREAREVRKASQRAGYTLGLPAVPDPEESIIPPTVETHRPTHPLQSIALAALAKLGSVDAADLADFMRGVPAPTSRERAAFRLVALDVLSELVERGVVDKDGRGRYHPAGG